MFKLTDKNHRILNVLKENSNLSTSKISKKTGIPITTVFNRIKKMEQEGIIKKYTVDLDHKKLGKDIVAFIFVNIEYKSLKEKKILDKEFLQKIAQDSRVEEAKKITGRYDIIIKVIAEDMHELNEFITKIQGDPSIIKTETMVVLDEASLNEKDKN